MPECADLIGSIQQKLPRVFFTEQTVLITASSGTGFWEAAVRNTINKKALNCVNGAFSDRFRMVTELNGKDNEVLEVPWGQPILAEQVAERLAGGGFDAVTVVHNETSTGVTSPLQEIAAAVRGAPNGEEIMILVDSVSGLSGARLEIDAWDLDVVLDLQPKSVCPAARPRLLRRFRARHGKAKTVPNRGYYFDFLALAKSMAKPDAGNAGHLPALCPGRAAGRTCWPRAWRTVSSATWRCATAPLTGPRAATSRSMRLPAMSRRRSPASTTIAR